MPDCNPHCWKTIHRLIQYERIQVANLQDEISNLREQENFDRMVMNRMRDDNTEFQNEIDNLKKENRQLKTNIPHIKTQNKINDWWIRCPELKQCSNCRWRNAFSCNGKLLCLRHAPPNKDSFPEVDPPWKCGDWEPPEKDIPDEDNKYRVEFHFRKNQWVVVDKCVPDCPLASFSTEGIAKYFCKLFGTIRG